MSSNVYFSPLDNKRYKSPLDKITRLLNACGIDSFFKENEIIAVKTHFGELGNTAFIKPIYLRPVIETLKKMKTRPYLTDTNTLYIGMRSNSVDHLHNAALNGFNYSTLQVPVIIADGLRGENTIHFKVDLELTKEAKLASDIINADGMVCMSHFKAHEIAGFGGAIKNISMGCASRQGKLEMHSKTRPVVKEKDCTGCERCIVSCQVKAIEMINKKAKINEKVCVGCARCISVCPVKAINVNYNASSEYTQQKMIEYAYALETALNKRIIYINVVTDITDACDCYGGNSKPIANDIGYFASLDPIALDKACYDAVIKSAGEDVFKKVYPDINPNHQFDIAKKIGFGSLDYKIVNIE